MDGASSWGRENGEPRAAGTGGLTEADRRLFDALPLGLVVLDGAGRVLRHNPAAAFLATDHANAAEALAAGTIESGASDWSEALAGVLRDGIPRRFEHVVWRDADRREYLLNIQCHPLSDRRASAITGATLVIEDVTATASMEKRLAVSERMAAVGKLAARVAHELNNPLDGILRYLNLAIRASEAGTTDRLGGYLRQARDGLTRMANILHELVDFSRGSRSSFDEADVNSIVEDAVKVMSDAAGRSDVSIICTLDSDMPALSGTNFFQVFCNLIKNAVDAMPEGGVLTITTKQRAQEAVIRFEDTGVGLPEDIERIFEPFFTTKPPGKGTGLGLAISREIIEKYGGRILARPADKQGTVFEVSIPLARCAGGRTSPLQPAEESGP